VRVRFTNPDPNYPLRIGTTATVEVSIHSDTQTQTAER